MKSSRIDWIDIAKGWGMLFVMLHHFILGAGIHGKSLFYSPFFLTVFFVASGMVFRGRQKFLTFLYKKIIGLLIPLFVLALIGIFSQKLISFRSETDISQQIKGLLIQKGTGGYALWFIAATFVISLFFYFLIKLPDPYFYFSNCIIVTLNIFLVLKFEKTGEYFLLPWHLDLVGIGCFWMAVGYKAKNLLMNEKIQKIISSYRYQLVIFVLYVSCLLISHYLFSVDYVSVLDINLNPVLYFGVNGLGVLWIFSFSMIRLPDSIRRFLIFIGQNTLFYFAFQGKLQSIIEVIYHKLTFKGIVSGNIAPILPVLVLLEALLLIIPCMIFSKMLPFAVGKGFHWEKTPERKRKI